MCMRIGLLSSGVIQGLEIDLLKSSYYLLNWSLFLEPEINFD